ncbi:MAG: hypothetical protein WA715_11775, partial [Candidatus Acidiferrum sp.]
AGPACWRAAVIGPAVASITHKITAAQRKSRLLEFTWMEFAAAFLSAKISGIVAPCLRNVHFLASAQRRFNIQGASQSVKETAPQYWPA